MKQYRHPQRPKKNALIAGSDAIRYALGNGEAIDRLYVDNTKKRILEGGLQKLAADAGVPINFVPAAKLNTFNVPHDGIIALRSRIRYQDVQDIISMVVERGETPLLLILDGVTDIRNIGGIARTALCAGVHALIIPDKGVGALNEDAILTSAGALEQLPVCRVNSLMKTVDDLHLNGIRVYATEMRSPQLITDTDLAAPIAIIMGSEDKGIYPALAKICDARISIPMRGDFESLNVSVATGMVLYEAMRQRGFAAGS